MTRRGRTLGRWRRDTRGVGATEMALLLPVLVLTMLGLLQVGRLATVMYSMREAVQFGVRQAIISSSSSTSPLSISQIRSLVQGRVQTIPGSSVSVEVLYTGLNQPGGWVDITASADVAPSLGFMQLPAIAITTSTGGLIVE